LLFPAITLAGDGPTIVRESPEIRYIYLTAKAFDPRYVQPSDNADGAQPLRSGGASYKFYTTIVFEHNNSTSEVAWAWLPSIPDWDGGAIYIECVFYKGSTTDADDQAVFSIRTDGLASAAYFHSAPGDTTAAQAYDMPTTATARVFVMADTLASPDWQTTDDIFGLGIKRLQNDANDDAQTDLRMLSCRIGYTAEVN
jgi:hypothetical protein